MKKTIATGFFAQDDVNAVCAAATLAAARQHLSSKIDAFEAAHPGVDPVNVRKARGMIEKERTINHLAISVQNFILAHPSEGLKVLK